MPVKCILQGFKFSCVNRKHSRASFLCKKKSRQIRAVNARETQASIKIPSSAFIRIFSQLKLATANFGREDLVSGVVYTSFYGLFYLWALCSLVWIALFFYWRKPLVVRNWNCEINYTAVCLYKVAFSV